MQVEFSFETDGYKAKIIAESLEQAYGEYEKFINTHILSEQSIEVSEVIASVNDGKVYWKAKGGKFRKWGVTLWEEVAEAAGLSLDTLSSNKAYIPPTGTVAEYITSDDGKPKKVSKLTFPPDAPETASDKDEFFARLKKECGITDTTTLVNMLKSRSFSSYNVKLQAAMASEIRGMLA